ncbi:hypothetical protein BDV39DRAFT_165205 [Aspergillus sergii]|uniref:Uncharacterized protein n=1 Tax=Aspergillus sergii TaxID=1034303 RepID=A0A5N6XLQ2_9EURO|nr:hypothetical protein BDV39DRAFT_165205 [Aspergillus sergii]
MIHSHHPWLALVLYAWDFIGAVSGFEVGMRWLGRGSRQGIELGLVLWWVLY